MKKVLSLLLAGCLIFSLVGCGSNDEVTSDSLVYVETYQSTEQKDIYKPDVDELEANLPGSKYELRYGTSGSTAQCTIYFFDDISRSGDVLEGHCQRTWYDGSKGDKVSYRYSGGKLHINQLSDEKIAMGYTDNKYDYIVYKNYLIQDKKIKNAKITTDGNFDALIGGYQKFNSDGTVNVKEYKIDDTIVFEEGQYSGTYTRDGNIVKCDTYCRKNNRNNTWYMYIDDYGYVYSEVFACKSFVSSEDAALQGTNIDNTSVDGSKKIASKDDIIKNLNNQNIDALVYPDQISYYDVSNDASICFYLEGSAMNNGHKLYIEVDDGKWDKTKSLNEDNVIKIMLSMLKVANVQEEIPMSQIKDGMKIKNDLSDMKSYEYRYSDDIAFILQKWLDDQGQNITRYTLHCYVF